LDIVKGACSKPEDRGTLGATESQAILTEGMRRYGEPEISERGVVSWRAGRTLLARGSDERGLYRIVMVSTGPGYDSCSAEHMSISGHPLSDHWMKFLPNNGAR